jgi:DNA polymerase III subunit alpha
MKIVGKQRIEDQSVYDIGVEKDHNFLLADGQVASNCFNKSHSVAYSMLSYRTAYLKCHYPSDFYAAELTSHEGEVKKLLPAMADARAHHMKIKTPDINLSEECFTATARHEIRFGLAGIKGLGTKALQSIMNERANGSFESITGLCKRLSSSEIKSNNLTALARSGAFSQIETGMNTAELAEYAVNTAIALRSYHKDEKKGQVSIFSVMTEAPENEINVQRPSIHLDDGDELELEKEALGFYISGSPLDKYNTIKERSHIDEIESLEVDGIWVSVLARITELKIRNGKRGSFAILQLEDTSGSIGAKIWSNNMAEARPYLEEGKSVVVRGKTNSYKGLEIVVDSIVDAESEVKRLLKRVVIHRLDSTILNTLLQLPAGNVPIDLELSNGQIKQRLGFFEIQPHMLRELNEMD